MSQSFLVAILVAISAAIFSVIAVQVLSQAAESYKEKFTDHARIKLSDLFLMVEPEKIFIINLVLIFVVFLFSYLFFKNWVVASIFAIVSGFIPKVTFSVLTKRRNKQFLEGLPDMLLSTSTAMKAGSSLNQALESVVMEETGPIAQEFDLFLREMRVGVEFSQALDNVYKRVPLLDFKLIVSSMQISREIGGNLADTLERLADTLRRKIEMEGKIDALTAQGRAQGIVMTCLPLLLGYGLYLMEPDQMSIFWTHWLGWTLMVVMAVMMTIGYLVIRKIVNIDV